MFMEVNSMLIEKLLNTFLDLLDHSPIDGSCPFNSMDGKENYESNIMFVFRRFKAAEYHYENVCSLLNVEMESIDKYDSINYETIKENIEFKLNAKVSRIDIRYSNEFIAFLSAIRSGIDFMSTIMIRHLKGVTGDSITTLLRLNQKKENQILNLITVNNIWLLFIRDYRDKLIHNYNQVYYIGSEYLNRSGVTSKVFYPVLVSSEIPNFELDTRRSRQLVSVENKFQRYENSYEIKIDDVVIERKVEIKIEPEEGYEPIQYFMKTQCEKYLSLFSEMLNTLIDIKLNIIDLEAKI